MKAAFKDCTCYVSKGKITPESRARCPRHPPEYSGPSCSTMYDRLKASTLSAAEAWATHAYLRSCATTLIEEYGTVEDALLACMYHIVILQELEGT